MLLFSVVCMLVFTSTFPRVFSDHEHETHLEINKTDGVTFEVEGIQGLNFYQAVTHFIDLENEKVSVPDARNITQHELGLLLDSLKERLGCDHHHDDHDHDHDHHDHVNNGEAEDNGTETFCEKVSY